MSKTFEAKLEELNALIRSGRTNDARLLIKKAARRTIPREFKGSFASLALRVDLPEVTVGTLNASVRPSGRKSSEATPKERAEYAAGLIKLGAPDEGLEILSTVDRNLVPITYLYEATALISVWNYRAVIPVLRDYLRIPSLDSYQRLVARTNLAMALVYEREKEAPALVQELLRESKETGKLLIHTNVLMMAIFMAIDSKRWREAEALVEEAESGVKNSQTLDALFVKKWRALLQLCSQPSSKHIKKLDEVRQEAASLRHWETLRNCDYHQALATQDAALLHKVYFGSPWETYRARLLADFGATAQIPDSFIWELPKAAHSLSDLDLFSGKPSKHVRSPLKPGQTLHQLLAVLASDFYRPQRTAAIYAKIYPREYFNPTSAPTRIWQLIKRLRQWMLDNKIPLSVEETLGSYHLVANPGCRIRIPSARPILSREHLRLARLRQEFFIERRFTSAEVMALLDANFHSANRFIKWCVENGELEREGVGKKTLYFIPGEIRNKAA